MVISTRRGQDAHVLAVTGELDLATAPRLEREINASEATSPPRIVLDLRGLKFLDSTGLRLILAADQRARASGRSFELVRAPANVHRLFGITGLDRRLSFVDDVPDPVG